MRMVNASQGVCIALGAIGSAMAGAYLLRMLHIRQKWKRAQSQWAKEDANTVILHQFPRTKKCLSASPFPIKVETYLRITGIKYVSDFDFPCHPDTHKSPWITLRGEHIPDSQLTIAAMNKVFNKDLGSHLAPKEKAVARSMRILLEDHFYWVFIMDRYMNQQARYMDQVYAWVDTKSLLSRAQFEIYRRKVVKKLSSQAFGQGLVRLGRGAVQKMGIEDLEAISALLGTKSYVMGGDKPTLLDCTLFGFVACIVYTCQEDSIYKTLVEKRLTNLNQHCLRMKAKYFPDWNDLILNGTSETKSSKSPEATKAKDRSTTSTQNPLPPTPKANVK
eukprot:maker-scaffold1462_size40154-snap-gene-0.10 protein:Tk08135 transcript:maker-scaffold1462_size40154-snap-gene-0.10-mRNA-1 annotation:"gst-n-metaxin-like protein"